MPLSKPPMDDNILYPDLKNYFERSTEEVDSISKERQHILEKISSYLYEKMTKIEPTKLIFICTHNSCRSQIAQLWVQIATHYYGITDLQAFSGGTEVSAFNPKAINTLARAGLKIKSCSTGTNPIYHVTYGFRISPIEMFSKTYQDPSNPQNNFCTILTCESADRNCPIITNSDDRFVLYYKDPKEFDNTPREKLIYDTTCRQISREICYIFSNLVSKFTPKGDNGCN